MAARKAPLRAVAAGERDAPKVPKSVTAAAKGGTTRELLVAMRDRTAIAVEDPTTPARDLSSLTIRLLQIVREIEAIDARDAEDGEAGAEVQDGDFDASAV